MVDTNKLKGAIARAGHKQNTLASALNMTKTTLSAKVNGKAKITTDEAKRMCDILGIVSEAEKVEIFLA